ncbi:hypothetical protein A3461_21160 [Enterobacter roggenkampii]|nr:hypothetical protein A3461_21160 [Enterobacter roggenkampii]
MMSLWDALRMNMMISYQELVRTFPKNVVIKNDGLAPMRELINIRRSGLTSPFIWLSRAGYLGFFIGMLH